MKKLHTIPFSAFISLLLINFEVKSQICNELFISEYLEGSNNDKALELYNPTPNPINLSQYRLIRWANGSITADQPGSDGIQPLGGIIQPFGTWVISLGILVGGGSTGNPTDSLLMAIADTVYTSSCQPGVNPPQPRVMCFNGDDAISLQKLTDPNNPNNPSSWRDVDILGIIGEQPTNASGTTSPVAGWTALSPYWKIPTNYNSSVQGPYFKQYWTQNHKMIRKPNVKEGVSTRFVPYEEPGKFNPAAEWDSLPSLNYAATLGNHTCDCVNHWSIEENALLSYFIFPNPFSDQVFIKSSMPILTISLYDVFGRKILLQNLNSYFGNIFIEQLAPGSYIIELEFLNGEKIRKVLQH